MIPSPAPDADPTVWRHHLHRHPELGAEVPDSAALVAGLLGSFGCDEVATGVGGHGVVGVIRGAGPGPSIGLRADLDALPIDERADHDHRSEVAGAFHGCGHDGHTAMLLGAARALAAERSFAGTVHVIFQPDEENGRGATAMIDDGLFERWPMEEVHGLHNMPGLAAGTIATRPGPLMSSEDLFEITVTGRGGHASTPERHVDPVPVVGQIIGALQTIVARSVAAADTAVVSITDIDTDGARNIIPSTVRLRGDCRTFSTEVRAVVESTMRRLVDGICAAAGATGTVDYHNEFVPLVNHEGPTATAVAAATAAIGADRVDGDQPAITASEDFARMLEVVPGCYVFLGNGTGGPCGRSLHNPSYDFNDEVLDVGVAYWRALVDLRCR